MVRSAYNGADACIDREHGSPVVVVDHAAVGVVVRDDEVVVDIGLLRYNAGLPTSNGRDERLAVPRAGGRVGMAQTEEGCASETNCMDRMDLDQPVPFVQDDLLDRTMVAGRA